MTLVFISFWLCLLSLGLVPVRDWIKLFITVELLILFLVLLFGYSSVILDDMIGALFSLILLPVAGAETAVALIILVLYYPQRKSIRLEQSAHNSWVLSLIACSLAPIACQRIIKLAQGR